MLLLALLLCSSPVWSSPPPDVNPEAEYRITGAELLELWSLIETQKSASIELRNVSEEELDESRKRVSELRISYAESQSEVRSQRNAKEQWRAAAISLGVTTALSIAAAILF